MAPAVDQYLQYVLSKGSQIKCCVQNMSLFGVSSVDTQESPRNIEHYDARERTGSRDGVKV